MLLLYDYLSTPESMATAATFASLFLVLILATSSRTTMEAAWLYMKLTLESVGAHQVMTPPMTPPAMTASSRVFHQVEISKSTSSLRRRTLPSAPENSGCDAMEVARAFSSYIYIYIYIYIWIYIVESSKQTMVRRVL